MTFKVGDRSGDLQDARISPGAQSERNDGGLEEFLAGLVNLAEFLDVAVAHLGVAVNLHPLEPLELGPSG